MNTRTLTIDNKLGLHARAAARFVNVASTFECEVSITMDGVEVNGKSIMGIMMLAAVQGTQLEVRTDGSDETAAIEKLTALIEDRFGEEE